MLNTKVPSLKFLTCLKVVSRKVPNGLKGKASLSKGILKSKTAKILVWRLLELSIQKTPVQMFVYLISEVLSNITKLAGPRREKVLLRTYCNVWIKRGLFEENFQSARRKIIFCIVLI